MYYHVYFPSGSVVKNPLANAGDVGSIPGPGRSPGVRNDNPLQYSSWEIPWTEEPGGLQSMGSQELNTIYQLSRNNNKSGNVDTVLILQITKLKLGEIEIKQELVCSDS